MNALEIHGLTKHYKDFALGPLDLTLPGGTICGLVGENGAGKSTTMKLKSRIGLVHVCQFQCVHGTYSPLSK